MKMVDLLVWLLALSSATEVSSLAAPLMERRPFLAAAAATTTAWWCGGAPSQAAVTDATDAFADNWWSSSPPPQSSSSPSSSSPATSSTDANTPREASDQVTIVMSKQEIQKRKLGLELADIEFRTNIRVYVKSVQEGSYAQALGIQKDWIAVALNDVNLERTNAAGVAQYLSQAVQDKSKNDSVTFVFRDPSVFSSKLQNLQENNGVATTQVAPSGDTTQRNPDGSVKVGRTETTAVQDQRITVEQLIPPKLCQRRATTDDLLEISYTGTVVETGEIFDGSAVLIDGKGIPGRGNDITIFFVLGKQPFGQFPPGWDVGLQGMCVGERRRLIVPPALGYGSQGVPRRRIPKDATLQYDVTLTSLNGLATP